MRLWDIPKSRRRVLRFPSEFFLYTAATNSPFLLLLSASAPEMSFPRISPRSCTFQSQKIRITICIYIYKQKEKLRPKVCESTNLVLTDHVSAMIDKQTNNIVLRFGSQLRCLYLDDYNFFLTKSYIYFLKNHLLFHCLHRFQ